MNWINKAKKLPISRGKELGPDGFYYTYRSDFDILAITDTKERAGHYHTWDRLEDRFYRSPGVRTPVTLI